jgi:hypothetical protein
MKIAIIGNGPSALNISEKIDKFDYVIRFNNFELGGPVGKKTSLIILNSGKFQTGMPIYDGKYRKDGSSVLVYIPYPCYTQKQLFKIIKNNVERFITRFKFKVKICTPKDSKLVYDICPQFNDILEFVRNKKITGSNDRAKKNTKTYKKYINMPSSGIFAIVYALRHYPKDEIHVFGCDHLKNKDSLKLDHHYMKNSTDTPHAHNWDLEKTLVEILVKKYDNLYIK